MAEKIEFHVFLKEKGTGKEDWERVRAYSKAQAKKIAIMLYGRNWNVESVKSKPIHVTSYVMGE